MTHRSCTFTHAIARLPATTIVDGLRAVDTGAPNLSRFRQHHGDYVDALRSTGAVVEVLPPLEQFPDSVFVDDAALCLPEGAVLMRPGAPSRLGEARAMAPHLAKHYEEVHSIEEPGFIDGGDILTTEREILVGQSARTKREGIEAPRNIVARWGYAVREVSTPDGVLHFKSDCSLLDEETILATPGRIRLLRGLPCDPYGRRGRRLRKLSSVQSGGRPGRLREDRGASRVERLQRKTCREHRSGKARPGECPPCH